MGRADWGRKYAKAPVESGRRGVKTGIAERKKGCWRGAEESFMRLWTAYDERKAGSGPKAENPLHHSFQIPGLICFKPFLQ